MQVNDAEMSDRSGTAARIRVGLRSLKELSTAGEEHCNESADT